MTSQAQKIRKLEATCVDLKHEKQSVMANYWRLVEKHKRLIEKTERERAKLTEAHAMELAKVQGELDQETQNYTDYHLNMRRCLHHLHEIVASMFDEVRVRCLPFPTKSVKVEEFIDWIAREVRIVPDTISQLNDNFIVLAIDGILNMLNYECCQELGRLRRLAASSDASIVQDVSDNVQKLAGKIMRRWRKSHGLRPFVDLRWPTSGS
jgi:hypothetical protein